MTTKTKNTKTVKTIDEMTVMYHEWRLLKKQVDAMEKELKQWTTDNVPLPVAPSKEWGPAVVNEQVILANVEDFEQSLARIIGPEATSIAVTRNVTQVNLDAACALVAKRQGSQVKEVREFTLSELGALGYLDTRTKTVFAERTVKVDVHD
jgi:hypothetical protein